MPISKILFVAVFVSALMGIVLLERSMRSGSRRRTIQENDAPTDSVPICDDSGAGSDASSGFSGGGDGGGGGGGGD